jgi:hypothetical protein
MGEFLLLFSVAVAPWLLSGWLRLPRYVGYMQHADYDLDRYGKLLASTKAENRYLLTFIILLVILFFVVACPFLTLGAVAIKQPLAAVVVYLALFIIAICFAPRRLTAEQKYRRDSRVIRLLILSFWLELIPTLISLGLMLGMLSMIFDPNNSPESMILAFGLIHVVLAFGVCAGPIGLALTSFSVVFAQLINRLIESLIRRQSA